MVPGNLLSQLEILSTGQTYYITISGNVLRAEIEIGMVSCQAVLQTRAHSEQTENVAYTQVLPANKKLVAFDFRRNP